MSSVQPPLPDEPVPESSAPVPAEPVDVERATPQPGTAPSDAADDDTVEPSSEPDPWQAVFSPEANGWYFWNSKTNETTWTNPRDPTTASTPSTAPHPPLPTEEPTDSQQPPESSNALPPIDPDLAWLDPAAAARGSSSSTAAQTARFNARTGRFQVENHHLTPDRISDYQRSNRQQEAYYDVKGWEQQLDGKGLKRSATDSNALDASETRKRPSSKQVEKFKQQKQDKKKKKLTSWLAN
ncbi:WW domain-containing protein [Sporobolomyces koalae]|uniref:WW domain-containing protein n=1 Tax=Sporobolomyces koalae TaxID=500713 RepID=UPI00316F79F2